MGGVVEVNTLQDAQAGFTAQVVLSGGSFDPRELWQRSICLG